jgi:hypothetical protein
MQFRGRARTRHSEDVVEGTEANDEEARLRKVRRMDEEVLEGHERKEIERTVPSEGPQRMQEPVEALLGEPEIDSLGADAPPEPTSASGDVPTGGNSMSFVEYGVTDESALMRGCSQPGPVVGWSSLDGGRAGAGSGAAFCGLRPAGHSVVVHVQVEEGALAKDRVLSAIANSVPTVWMQQGGGALDDDSKGRTKYHTFDHMLKGAEARTLLRPHAFAPQVTMHKAELMGVVPGQTAVIFRFGHNSCNNNAEKETIKVRLDLQAVADFVLVDKTDGCSVYVLGQRPPKFFLETELADGQKTRAKRWCMPDSAEYRLFGAALVCRLNFFTTEDARGLLALVRKAGLRICYARVSRQRHSLRMAHFLLSNTYGSSDDDDDNDALQAATTASLELIHAWSFKIASDVPEQTHKLSSWLSLFFTASLPTVAVPQHQVATIPDIEEGPHCFTDGAGLILQKLADAIVQKLRLAAAPSAFQIRYAGCKGVVVAYPSYSSSPLALRPSMKKFDSAHTSLEVVSWSPRHPAMLNQHIAACLQRCS